MAKILNFRNKGETPSHQDFLTDGNQTLSFRTTEDGGISLGNLSQADMKNLFPDPKKDWSNQELADLFRVRQLLSGANVPVETDRGVTDEGDPWFVFCHANGEVFIHLCRIDGFYLLDSPNVLRPLRGADFAELIADFTNQALPARGPDDDAERRVIRLERGGKIRLHPSAMLAALIWTLFLAAEELVLLAPEEDQAGTDTDALLDFDGMVVVNVTETADMSSVFEDDTVDVASLLKGDTLGSEDTPEAHGQMREVTQQQGLTAQNNAFSLGLSTIAIAMGFMSETVLLDNQRKVLESLKQLGFSEYGNEAQQVAGLDVPTDAESGAILELLAEFLGLDLSLNTDIADISAAQADRTELKAHVDDLLEENESKATLPIATKTIANAIDREKVEVDEIPLNLAKISEDDTNLEIPENVDGNLSAESERDASTLTLSQIVQNWRPEMEEFQLGHSTLFASFDLKGLEEFAFLDLVEQSSAPQRKTSLDEFDDHAQSVIEFFKNKSGDLGIIEHDNGFIFIDREAVSGGQVDYMLWEADDGKVISIIGLASDFQQFDMIA